jgi:hypothetical protein
LRDRWFGATHLRVPEIAVEGDPTIPLAEALVLDSVDVARLREAHERGKPVVVRADSPEAVREALERPEVAVALVPPDRNDLLELDLVELTYGP